MTVQNVRSQASQVHQQPETVQEHDEDLSVGKRLTGCLPTDPRTFLFVVVAVVYLIIGVIHFCHTGDTTMLTTLLASTGAYVGLPEIKVLISRGKKGEPHL